MTEDIPDDIMKTAEKTHTAILGLGIQKSVMIIAIALHIERKKWDGASTFNRCMEK